MPRLAIWAACLLASALAAAQAPAVDEAAPVPTPEAAPGPSHADASALPDVPSHADLDQPWLWAEVVDSTPAPRAHLDVPLTTDFPADSNVPFTCVIHSKGRYPETHVTLAVYDNEGTRLGRDALTIDLYQGPNECRFLWEAAPLPPGKYTLHFKAQYPGDDPAATCDVRARKVAPRQLVKQIGAMETRLKTLRTAGKTVAESSRPYLAMRLAAIEQTLTLARRAADTANWRRLNTALARAQRLAQGAYAAMVLQPRYPLLGPPAAQMSQLQIRDGGFFAGDRPVFLFGAALPEADPDSLKRFAGYGLNLSVVPLSPETRDMPRDFAHTYDAVFETAEKHHMAVVADLNPGTLATALDDPAPGMVRDGQTNLAQPQIRKRYYAHVADAAAYLARKPAVHAVSLANEPRFWFENDRVRNQYIDFVRGIYEDRHALNRSWRAYLADFDDITIKNGHPEWDYHNKRAYQWDWQHFQQQLTLDYFSRAQALLHDAAPALPTTVVLSDSVFEVGESRHGIDRELLAQKLDLTGCTATLSPESELYAYSYPYQSAFCTLMRSMQPTKPVICTENTIELDPAMRPDDAFDYVYAAMWDAVISGLNAMALPADSPVFTHAETAEAFATANLDINRLATVVHALQRAPADVGILWSDASKVFDDGKPYLRSARFAYEGVSFAGYQVRYITEQQIRAGMLDSLAVLVIPETPAMRDESFAAIQEYVDTGGSVARVGTPIPYDQHGRSRQNVLRPTGNTVLVRGMNLPTEYLHAMDAVIEKGGLDQIPRPINAHGYPLEGVKTRYVQHDGDHYLFVLNLRADPVDCFLAGPLRDGRDLIRNERTGFPRRLEPLKPMLIRMQDRTKEQRVETHAAATR